MVKYLSQFGTFQLVFFRSFITLVFTLGFLLVNKIPLLGHQRKLLFYRGISGATSMILFFSALHFMAIGTAVTLRYTAPLFVALLSVWVLKEKIKGIQWFFFLLAFGGVVTIKGFDANVSL
jgi:drug/metabolite transporter (DMT)-like permease